MEQVLIESVHHTRASLLVRLGADPHNNPAWNLFIQRYGPRIKSWCDGWGLQPADAEDVVQMVLVRLAVKLRAFRYDPDRSFRAWLKTLTRHAWSDYVSDRMRSVPATGGSAAEQALMTVAAADDLQRRMDEAFDLELLELASQQVQSRVARQTWEAFRLTALEGMPAADVALRLGMPVVSVFKAKSNVRKMLAETVAEIESQQGRTSS